MTQRRILLLAPLVALAAACANQPTATPASIADTIAQQPELSTFNALVLRSGLTESLKAPGPYTVFAPTNEAFKTVPAKTMDELSRDPGKLKSVLTYHMIPAKVTSAEVKNSTMKTSQGANIAVSKAGAIVTVENAMVERADIKATNGVVHTVDRVLLPPSR